MEELNLEKVYRRKFTKEFFVDFFALNSFMFVVTSINELLIAGLDTQEWIRTRILNFFFNSFTVTPYSYWRRFVFGKLKISVGDPQILKYVGDTICFITFHVPIYAFTMFLAGAETLEMFKACSVAIIGNLFIGRPYGIYLDYLRKKFNVMPLLDKKVK